MYVVIIYVCHVYNCIHSHVYSCMFNMSTMMKGSHGLIQKCSHEWSHKMSVFKCNAI
jgi:hypothetical protein